MRESHRSVATNMVLVQLKRAVDIPHVLAVEVPSQAVAWDSSPVLQGAEVASGTLGDGIVHLRLAAERVGERQGLDVVGACVLLLAQDRVVDAVDGQHEDLELRETDSREHGLVVDGPLGSVVVGLEEDMGAHEDSGVDEDCCAVYDCTHNATGSLIRNMTFKRSNLTYLPSMIWLCGAW